MRQAELDRSKPFAEISGPPGIVGAGRYEQNYCVFDRGGRYIGPSANAVAPPPGAVPELEATAAASGAPPGLENWTWQALDKEMKVRGGAYDKALGTEGNAAWLREHWDDGTAAPPAEPDAPAPSPWPVG